MRCDAGENSLFQICQLPVTNYQLPITHHRLLGWCGEVGAAAAGDQRAVLVVHKGFRG
jgi:hypothetical protein